MTTNAQANPNDPLANLKVITTDLERILSICMLAPMDDPSDNDCRWGAPVLIWGPPGIGKSGRIEHVGKMTGMATGTVYLSTHQPEDISGVFMPDGKGGAITVCPLPQVNYLVREKRGILFLDEISNARPVMQGAGLSVVRERFWAGHRLPGGIRIIAAANPVDVSAGGFNLQPPMSNRFLHFVAGVPSIEDWTSWLLSGTQGVVHPITQGEAKITAAWPLVWSKIRGLGVGFMKNRRLTPGANTGSTLYALPPQGSTERGRAWASPRSWEMALRCVATAEILEEKELGLELLSAAVGPGFAVEWAAWVAQANLPDPEEMLKHGWKPDKKRLDIAMAGYSSAISYALSKKDKEEQKKYAILAWKLLQGPCLRDGLSDIALAPAASLMRAGYSYQAGGEIAEVSQEIIFKFGSSGLASYVRKGG